MRDSLLTGPSGQHSSGRWKMLSPSNNFVASSGGPGLADDPLPRLVHARRGLVVCRRQRWPPRTFRAAPRCRLRLSADVLPLALDWPLADQLLIWLLWMVPSSSASSLIAQWRTGIARRATVVPNERRRAIARYAAAADPRLLQHPDFARLRVRNRSPPSEQASPIPMIAASAGWCWHWKQGHSAACSRHPVSGLSPPDSVGNSPSLQGRSCGDHSLPRDLAIS